MTPSRNNKSVVIAKLALLTTLALIFSYIESIVPLVPSHVGIKLGVANLVVIIVMYSMGARYAFFINVLRIVLAGLLFNGVFGMLYSLGGGIISFIGMYLLKKSNKFTIVSVSMAGAVFHNLGQITTAAILLSSTNIYFYLPVLIIAGIISGTVIGVIAYYLLQKLPKSIFK